MEKEENRLDNNTQEFNFKSIDYRDESYSVRDISDAQQQRKERRDLEYEASQERKERRRRINRNRRIVLAIIAIIIIGFLGLVGNNILALNRLKQEKAEKEKELEKLRYQQEALTEELEQVNSDEYIEQQARSDLHMIRPGETLYIFEDRD